MGVLDFLRGPFGKRKQQMLEKGDMGRDNLTTGDTNIKLDIFEKYKLVQYRENDIGKKIDYILGKCDELYQIQSNEYKKPEEEWNYDFFNECDSTIKELNTRQSQLWALCRQLTNIEKDILEYKNINMNILDEISEKEKEIMEQVEEILNRFYQQTNKNEIKKTPMRKKNWNGQPLDCNIEVQIPSKETKSDTNLVRYDAGVEASSDDDEINIDIY